MSMGGGSEGPAAGDPEAAALDALGGAVGPKNPGQAAGQAVKGPLRRFAYSRAKCTPEWCDALAAELERSTWAGRPQAVQQVLATEDVLALAADCTSLVAREPTMLEVDIDTSEGVRVSVVGDTHGQFHDVLRLLSVAGRPSSSHLMVFNGDFIDRGAWGFEVLVLLAAWKVALPHRALLLRGNHESVYCASTYGFCGEVEAKYGPRNAKRLFAGFKRLFASLPLACLVCRTTLVLHGGLFRKPAPKGPRSRKRRRVALTAATSELHGTAELGSLDDLRLARKGGLDPDGMGAAAVATDVLWSDPAPSGGLVLNDSRGVGLIFGPEVTETFLQRNGVRLVVRSHEGPDARANRDDGMKGMEGGYAVDHEVASGKLVTVFSAPDYPQFQDTETRLSNKGAVVVLRPETGYAEPEYVQFDAVLPRPPAKCYYDMEAPGSDEEIDVERLDHEGESPSDASGDPGIEGSDSREACEGRGAGQGDDSEGDSIHPSPKSEGHGIGDAVVVGNGAGDGEEGRGVGVGVEACVGE